MQRSPAGSDGGGTAIGRLRRRLRSGPGASIWLTAALLGTVLLGVIGWHLVRPRHYYTGSNSVGVRGVVATLERDQRLCVPEIDIPRGTARVQFALFAERPQVRAEVRMAVAGRTLTTIAQGRPGSGNRVDLAGAFPEPTPDAPHAVRGTVCVTPLDGPASIGGMADLQGDQVPARVDGQPLPHRVAVWFLPPEGERRSLISAAGDLFSRAALFRPGIVGPWTYPVLLLVVFPLIAGLGLWLLARAAANRPTRVKPAMLIGLIAFVSAGTWALITPAFNAPDEPDHFAYAQHLAETGKQPARGESAAGAYSSDHTMAIDALRTYSYTAMADGRPPWLPEDEERWRQRRASIPNPKDNGGGVTVAAAPHHPTYYGALAPAYLAVASQSPFSQLTAMRLVSALFGAIVAVCAFGIVRELFPRQRVAAIAAGLLVAFHPMFTFIAGAVNNDNGVNAAAAVSLYLVIRGLRRGPTWRLMVALGAAVAITPLMKGTGLAIMPAIGVGVLGMLWRYHRREHLLGWAALVAAGLAVRGAWSMLSTAFERPVADGGGAAIASETAISTALSMPGGYLSYLWQVVLPRLAFMTDYFVQTWPFFDIYVIRGWAAFGWYAVGFPRWTYLAIVCAMALVGLLALVAVIRERVAAWRVNIELAVIALIPICVVTAVAAAYFSPGGARPVPAEQGRYAFPAMAALAVIAVGGSFGLGRRWHVPLVTALVVAMIGLAYASRWAAMAGFYS